MTTFVLIRHGESTAITEKVISGCLPGIHLSRKGRAQAESLPERLKGTRIRAIYSSPLERCQETAAPLSARLGLPIVIAPEITEIGFGDWSGETIAALDELPLFHRFNAFRSGTRAPNGELMLEVQARSVTFLTRLREAHPDGTVAVVSHADVIRSVLMYYLGMPMDFFHRFKISPASVSVMTLDDWGAVVLCLNHTGPIPCGD